MVCPPFCSADGSQLLILPPVNGFYDGLCAVLPGGWQQIADNSSCQWLSRQLGVILLRGWHRVADSSTCRQLSQWLHAVLLCRWHRVAHSSAGQRLSRRFACCISQRMAVYYSFCHLSTVFTVCALYCSVEGGGLLILPFVHGLHDGLHAVSLILPVVSDFPHLSRVLFLNPWQRIARSSARRWVSRFAHCIA